MLASRVRAHADIGGKLRREGLLIKIRHWSDLKVYPSEVKYLDFPSTFQRFQGNDWLSLTKI